MKAPLYGTANWIAKHLLLPVYTGVDVRGAENIPRSGPVVLASNHLNDADPALIASNYPRRVVFLAKVELFRIPVLGQFMRLYGAVPVRRHHADLTSLRRALEALEQGLTVGIFPEGTRSGEPARLREGWPGAALVALRSGAPVLPLAITGSQRMGLPLLFLRPFPRQHVTLTYGEPFYLQRPGRLNAEAAREATRQIMQRIAALLPPEYQGYYGESSGDGGQPPAPSGAGAE